MFILGIAVGVAFAWFIVPDPPSWVVAGKNWVWGKVSEMLTKK